MATKQLQQGTRVYLPALKEAGIVVAEAEVGTVLDHDVRSGTVLVDVDQRYLTPADVDGLREVPRRTLRVLQNKRVEAEDAERLQPGSGASAWARLTPTLRFYMLASGVLGCIKGDDWNTLRVFSRTKGWVRAGKDVAA